jgi:hypothetical protein
MPGPSGYQSIQDVLSGQQPLDINREPMMSPSVLSMLYHYMMGTQAPQVPISQVAMGLGTGPLQGPRVAVPPELESALGGGFGKLARGKVGGRTIKKTRPWDMPEAEQPGIYSTLETGGKKVLPESYKPGSGKPWELE